VFKGYWKDESTAQRRYKFFFIIIVMILNMTPMILLGTVFKKSKFDFSIF